MWMIRKKDQCNEAFKSKVTKDWSMHNGHNAFFFFVVWFVGIDKSMFVYICHSFASNRCLIRKLSNISYLLELCIWWHGIFIGFFHLFLVYYVDCPFKAMDKCFQHWKCAFVTCAYDTIAALSKSSRLFWPLTQTQNCPKCDEIIWFEFLFLFLSLFQFGCH